MRYFAYGSNMCFSRMKLRVPSAATMAVGRLKGHVLKFHMKSTKDDSGKCDAYENANPDDHIWGVIYEIDPIHRKSLDKSEAVGVCYAPKDVEILTPAGPPVSAFTYIALDDAIDPGAVPYEWYKLFVLEGAIQNGLPRYYIDSIAAVPAVSDPDSKRERKKRLIALGHM